MKTVTVDAQVLEDIKTDIIWLVERSNRGFESVPIDVRNKINKIWKLINAAQEQTIAEIPEADFIELLSFRPNITKEDAIAVTKFLMGLYPLSIRIVKGSTEE